MSVAAAVKDSIQRIGGAFMFSREARKYGESTGVPGFIGPYARGRGGVLGDVDAGVVVAAFGFLEPETLRAAWDSVTVPSAEAAEAYLGVCQDFGRRKLAGFAESERLAELLQAVAAAAEVPGVPLFAGWRVLPAAADAPARVLQYAHVLRELRGGLHLMAVLAAGLTPLQAVLISGSPLSPGPIQARAFGWAEPFEEITAATRARWESAEAVTDALIAPAFAVLGEDGAELAGLLERAEAQAFGR
ncbi:SCO6745 family protein [Nocardia sp. alder85J]|uniref:SCO6745 family protein n=1 Tax=Nocardia sp. alder85J TaxID=2862949 RepID=UPI001CD3FDB0|nr:hypothetical protein [Nocardia sp. alder85J]MCX4092862.1 hypothetical protein [Nocardia sp. alder85J]